MNAPSIDALNIKIFADGADLATIQRTSLDPLIKGFTTNPTLMRRAGVSDYGDFALRGARASCPTGRSRFEVFADDFAKMEPSKPARSPRGARTSTSRFR